MGKNIDHGLPKDGPSKELEGPSLGSSGRMDSRVLWLNHVVQLLYSGEYYMNTAPIKEAKRQKKRQSI